MLHGPTVAAIEAHLTSEHELSAQFINQNVSEQDTVATAIRVRQGDEVCEKVQIFKPFSIEIEIAGPRTRQSIAGIVVHNAEQELICHVSDEFGNEATEHPGTPRRICTFPAYLLRPGVYFLSVHIGERGRHLHHAAEHCVRFEVEWTGPMTALTSEADWKGFVGPGMGTWDFAQ